MTHDERFGSILRAARQGAEWAWELLVRDIDGVLRGYLRRQGGIDVDALAGDTWLQVARGLRRFEGDEKAFRSWVFMIAHHRLVDERRRLRRKPTDPVEDEELDGRLAPARSAEADALDRLDDERIHRILEGLTRDQREVILLRFVVGFGPTEIGRVMGKAPGAVRALQRRALKRLEGILERDGTV